MDHLHFIIIIISICTFSWLISKQISLMQKKILETQNELHNRICKLEEKHYQAILDKDKKTKLKVKPKGKKSGRRKQRTH